MERRQINENVISDTFRKSANVMIAGSVTAFVGTTVDGVVTSRMLGVSYVSSFQLVQPLILIVTMLAMLIFNGLQNVYAKQIGAGRIHEAHTVMSLSIVILGVISAACILVYCLFGNHIVSGFGAADATSLLHTEAVAYIYGIAPGLIGICLQQLISYIMMMEGRQNVVLAAVLTQTVVNIVGDILVATVFHNGLFGMGLASTVCYYAAIAVFIFSMLRRPVTYKFSLRGARWESLGEVFKMGMPGAAERLYLVLQTLFLNAVLLARMGAEAVAAYAILSTLNNLLQSVATGTAGTTFTMASVYVGEKDGNSLKTTLRAAMRYVIIVEGIVLAVILVAAPVFILPFIGTDGETVQRTATFALRALALSVPLYGISHTYQRYIQAVGAMKMAYLIPALGSVIGFIPAALVLLAVCGERGVWFAFFAGEVISALIIMAITSVKEKRAALHFENYLYLPADMQGVDPDVMEVSVDDMASLLTLPAMCQGYCLDRGGESKKAMLIALSVEEMGSNIFRYNGGMVTVDVRLLKREGTWILRIRDNGRAFDPAEWMRIHQAEEKEKNIGIRMISGLCSRFEYISIMSMNNLIIYV